MEFVFAIGTAFWLGFLTSISPCPLATNIAAISFVSRKVGSVSRVLAAGLLYTLGRTLVYVVLGMLLVRGMMAAPMLSHILQKYMNLFMGPLLILVAMVLLELLKFGSSSRSGIGSAMQARVERSGIGGALILGVAFAMTMCPTSAALFFGSMLPISIQFNSGILIPTVYGLATGLPVLLFSFLLAFSANKVAKAYDKLAGFEVWAQRITGVVFLLVGLYMTLTITLGIRIPEAYLSRGS